MTGYEMDDCEEEIATLKRHRSALLQRAEEHEAAGWLGASEIAYQLAEEAEDEIAKIQGRIEAAQSQAWIENASRGGLPL